MIGILLNVAAVKLIYRTPSFHNAFGYICASHLVADVGVLTIFTFWAAPATLLGLSGAITHSYFGEKMGQLTVIFWFGSVYGQLQMALNRLLAICSPFMYKYVTGCNFLYDAESFLWTYSSTSCSRFVSFYIAFAYCAVLCATVIVIDTVAFLVILRNLKVSELRFSYPCSV
ncbi:hypothetical protein COOONC_22771 [Cooperia oncophora]